MSILHKKAFGGLLFLLLVLAALLFIPAWTLDYWQAWTFLAVYFASSLAITFYLMKKDPGLLQRRMTGGPAAEKQISQKIIMSFTCWDLSVSLSSPHWIIASDGLTSSRTRPSQAMRS